MEEKSEKAKEAETEVKTFDDLLGIIGHMGSLQKRILVALCLVAISVGYQNTCPVFTLNIPDHRCQIPELQNDTYAIQGTGPQAFYLNVSIPTDADGKYDQCHIYGYDSGVDPDDANVTSRSLKTCSAWVFDKNVFKRTLATDLGLVCEEKIMRSHSNMLIFAGKFFGAILQGFASDTLGRKKVLIVTVIGVLGCSIGNAFVSNVAALLAMRFLTGLMTTALYLVIFVIGVEFMPPSHRTVISTVQGIFFALGQMSQTPIAYFLRDWRHLQLAIAWPAVVLLIVVWFVPESPRWLLSKNRKEEAETVMRKAAKINKAELPDQIMPYLHVEEEHAKVPAYHLFSHVRLVIRWSVIYINWIVIAMVYYGLTLNVSNMSGNIFLNFFLTTAVDLAGKIMTGLLANKISRKFFHIFVMIVGGGACAAAFIPVLINGARSITIVLSMVGKLGISSAFYLIYIYTAELFPTSHRALGMGSSSMMARLGGIASPYVADLNTYVGGKFGQVLPQLVFGGAGIVGGLLTFLLPDTRGRRLPETIEDAKRFTENHEKKLQGFNENQEKMSKF